MKHRITRPYLLLVVALSAACSLHPLQVSARTGDGTLDRSFIAAGPVLLEGSITSVESFAVAGDGKVYIAGDFDSVGGVARRGVARLNADGTLDQSFDAGVDPTPPVSPDRRPPVPVFRVIVQPDGKVLISGFLRSVRGMKRIGIARINSDGSLDTSFDPGANVDYNVFSTALQSDGRIIIGGNFANDGVSTFRLLLKRLNANGSVDSTFSATEGESQASIGCVALQPDGKLLLSGTGFTKFNNQPRSHYARLNANGTVDTSFNPGGGSNFGVDVIAPTTDGKVMIGGAFTEVNGVARRYVARLNSGGTIDSTFDAGELDAEVETVATQADGKLLIGGFFQLINGVEHITVARLLSDGRTDESFNPRISGSFSTVTWDVQPQPDGRILFSGGGYGLIEDVRDLSLARVGPATARFANISTRLRVETGDNVAIAGFIVDGASNTTKKVLIRGMGPSLASAGLSGTISDPFLELHNPDGSTSSNDNWQEGANTNEIPDGFQPSDPRESVIIATVPSGACTAVLKGANGETGVGLVEVYDLETGSPIRLANISTRGRVGTTDNDAMIAGIIVQTGIPQVLVRALGPSLPVADALRDPNLELVDSNGNSQTNEDWQLSTGSEIEQTGIPPPNNDEAAIIGYFTPGPYTAIVRDRRNGQAGVALVEAYNLQ